MTDTITILFSGALSSAIVFLFRNWISERIKYAIKHEYDQKLETHKAQLEAESKISIEKLRSELQIAANERSIKLSKIFESQAATIVEIYKKLYELHQAVDFYNAVDRGATEAERYERSKELHSKRREFHLFFMPNRIYLEKDTAKMISDFEQKLYQIFLKTTDIADNATFTPPSVSGKQRLEISKEIHDEMPKLFSALEENFQRLLGFPIENTKSAES